MTLTAAAPALAQTAPAARAPVVFASQLPAPAFRLPQPVTSLFRDPAGRGAASVTAGSGTVGGWSVSADGRTATFDQGSAERVLLNWQTFDIAQGHTVRFLQDKDPAKYVSALNRVWGDNPSVIQGQLLADREVILVNPNGVHFGASARVQGGKLVASALSLPDAANARGLRNVTDASAVFTAAGTDHRATSPNAAVTLEAGAEITTAAGGDVLLVAPRVVNQGRIATPDGQTVLAAGDKVYLMSSSDPKQRGLIVAVDAAPGADGRPDATLGIAENSRGTGALAAQLNEIRADRGSVNLVGLTVRQNGAVNATTAVKGANGSVLLQAMATTTALDAQGGGQAPARGITIEAGSRVRVGDTLGTIEFGAGSVTAVLPQPGSGATQIDAEVFNRSQIRAEGAAIAVAAGAQIAAPSGDIVLKAARATTGDPIFDSEARGTGRADDSRIVVAPGALISAAGLADVAVDGARNQGAQRLFRIELADAPVQRSGPLYRQQVLFDLRDAPRIAAADVTGAAAAVARTVAEKSTAGGSVSLQTDGALVVGDGAALDVSGGSVRFSETVIRNSLLAIGSQGDQVVTFRTLPAGTRADALLPQTVNSVVPAFTQGADGGTLLLSGRQLALAGSVRGSVVSGALQRDQRSTPPQPATLAVGDGGGTSYYLDGIALRPLQTPLLSAAGVGGVFADLLGADLSALPTTAELSLARVAAGGFGSLRLRAATVTQPEFGRLDLGARGSLDIAANTVALDGAFGAAGGRIAVSTDGAGQGTIALSAATVLDAAGRWTNDSAAGVAGGGTAAGAPIGAVGAGAAATSAAIAATSVTPAPAPAPVQNDGGSVSLLADAALAVEPGARIDVSAGARLTAAGSVVRGKAGSAALAVQLANVAAARPSMRIDGLQLAGFDFAGGGTLALTAPSVAIGGAALAGGVSLAPAWFSASGFGSIGVAGGDLRVAAGAQLAPRLLNWQFGDGFRSAASGAMRDAVASAQPVDTRLADRSPVNLTLAAARPLNDAFDGGSVSVERGASVVVEPGGQIALQATLGIDVGVRGGSAAQAARLAAPGGGITLAISGSRGGPAAGDPRGFVPTQAIWLGDDARLAVDGAAQLRPDTAAPARFEFATSTAADATGAAPAAAGQRLTGSVLGGGTITLAAARGYVVAEAGSSMSLDGAAALVNVPGAAAAVRVARSAGLLSVSTPEGLVLDGSVSAQPPHDASGRALADGGRLQLSLGAGGVLPAGDASQRPYPATQRVLVVGSDDGELARRGTRWGDDPTATLGNGVGWVRSALLQGAGFGGLNLAAGDALQFQRSLTLALPLGVQLNAPAIDALPGTQLRFDAGYAQIGDASVGRMGAAPDTSAGADASSASDTRLTIRAPTIDVVGDVGLQGFSRTEFDASVAGGEIRLSAAAPHFDSVDSRERRLAFAGTLRLAAGQIYATSGTQYALVGSGADSRLETRAGDTAAPALPPLTALASISASAADIDHRGVLRQPFGRIALAAERTLTLSAGSVTSVSGDGAAVLYGQTVNLGDWVLPRAPGFNSAGDAERKGIVLSAARIATDASATVAAGGGGSLLAWEFFKGVGGTTDRYDDAGVWAVLPDRGGAAAVSVIGGILAPADAARQLVVTMAGSGLAPGRYTLLPARDALLAGSLPQGAFLVRRAADQGSTLLRAPIANDDGSVVVTAHVSSAGSVDAGVPGERYVVAPQSAFAAASDVRLTDISALRLARAAALGEQRPPLPRDGGLVQITAGNERSPWTAALDLAARGGQAGQLDISAPRVALLPDAATTPAATFGIGANVIKASGAGSVLLGGLRTRIAADDGASAAANASAGAGAGAGAAPAWRIDSSATERVDVDVGASPLLAEELLLAARGSVALAPATSITAAGSGTLGARTLRLAGDGALLAVSANPLDVQRSGVALADGRLVLGAGSALTAPQVVLDATRTLALPADTRLAAPALAIGAPRIVVGDAADPAVGAANGAAGATAAGGAVSTAAAAGAAPAAVLTGALLASVRGAADLSMRAYDSIDFAGTLDGSAHVGTRLVLDAPLVRGIAGADGSVTATTLAAQDVVLRNSSGAPAGDAGSGRGSLVLRALPPLRHGRTGGITIGAGALAIGFDSATLQSGGDIVLDGTGSLQANGALTLSAARLTATTGTAQRIAAAGALTVAAEPAARTLGERTGQGALVEFAGDSVDIGGSVDLRGGRLAVRASGVAGDGVGVRLREGAVVATTGFALADGFGFSAAGAAGSIDIAAAQGRVELAGTLDVGAAGHGDAGSVTIRASGAGGGLTLTPAARIAGAAGRDAGDRGGRIDVDVARLPDAGALAAAALAGGNDGSFALRVRDGDVALDAPLRAARISVAADAGRLAIGSAGAAVLDARAADGGVVQLAAGSGLVLGAGARIDARGSTAGGDVLLASRDGRVQLDAAATVDAGGPATADGRIVLRAQRGADAGSVQVDRLNPANLRAGDVAVEAVRVYADVAALTAADDDPDADSISQNRIRADNDAFMRNRGSVRSALGIDAAPGVELRAGVELRSTGDLVVADGWDFAAAPGGVPRDRPGASAGVLTLRAAGTLSVDQTLSDGFTSLEGGRLNDNARSWSLRLVGGADLAAANPLAVQNLAAGTVDGGDVVIGAIDSAVTVRTGAGSIALAAGRDVRLGRDVVRGPDGAVEQDAVAARVYSAGRKIDGLAALQSRLFGAGGSAPLPQFSEQGGRVELAAARDIVSPEATQLVGNWLWRNARVDQDGARIGALAWWTQFDRFAQGVGAFGGGSVVASAGGDIRNLQAMAPTAGWDDAASGATPVLRSTGGGSVTVRAGGDVLGGQLLLGRGEGRLDAGGSVAAAAANAVLGATVLGLTDGRWRVTARGGVELGAVLHPTAAPASAQDNRTSASGSFYVWGADAGIGVVANSGSVLLPAGVDENAASTLGVDATAEALQALSVLPPSLAVTAAAGDVTGRNNGVLFPSASGQLRLWAGGTLTLGTGAQLVMSDSDPGSWPSARHPAALPPNGTLGPLVTNTLDDTLALTGLHAADTEPARLHADGSVVMRGATAGATLAVPKPLTLSAGLDVVNLNVRSQHHAGDDVTTVRAGRNVLLADDLGESGRIEVVGPGALEVSAGRGVDLGASAGITTSGNLRSARLPAAGASVRVAAATGGILDIDVLRTRWLAAPADGGSVRSPQYRALLLQTVRDALQAPALTFDAALAAFAAFPATAQAAFGQRLLAEEFAATYANAPAPTVASVTAALRSAFDDRKASLLAAGEQALGAGRALVLPGREALSGDTLAGYLQAVRGLAFDSLDVTAAVRSRVASLSAVRDAGQGLVVGSDAFERWRQHAAEREVASAGAAAAGFGRLALPMRLALFDQGFAAAEFGGIGSFVAQPLWPATGRGTLLAFSGTLDLTQSGIVTQRGGDISLVNPGGAINVGLKDAAVGSNAPKGVIALGGGNVFGDAKGDFQVNTQRVFIVGAGDMNVWSSSGDIDSGRGANTAVAAPPLAPRRSADGVVFEVPATTTGSGLAILQDARGLRSGTIGLFPALGEILALDAFIRAPALVLSAPVKGADNLVSASIAGSGAPVAAPPPTVAAPANAAAETRAADATALRPGGADARGRNSLLTVELLGIGPGPAESQPRCADGLPAAPGGKAIDCKPAETTAPGVEGR